MGLRASRALPLAICSRQPPSRDLWFQVVWRLPWPDVVQAEFLRVLAARRQRRQDSQRAKSPPTFSRAADQIELVASLKTAKELSLTIPQSILARVDELME